MGRPGGWAGRLQAVFVSSSVNACMAAMAAAAVGVAISDYAAVDAAATAQAEQLRAEVRRHSDTDDLDITFVHAYGDPGRELLRIAAEAGADLIVVGRSEKARHHWPAHSVGTSWSSGGHRSWSSCPEPLTGQVTAVRGGDS